MDGRLSRMWNEQNGSGRTQPNTLSKRQDLGFRATKNPTRVTSALRRMGACLAIVTWALLQDAQSQALPAGSTIHVQLKESLSSDTSHLGAILRVLSADGVVVKRADVDPTDVTARDLVRTHNLSARSVQAGSRSPV